MSKNIETKHSVAARIWNVRTSDKRRNRIAFNAGTPEEAVKQVAAAVKRGGFSLPSDGLYMVHPLADDVTGGDVITSETRIADLFTSEGIEVRL